MKRHKSVFTIAASILSGALLALFPMVSWGQSLNLDEPPQDPGITPVSQLVSDGGQPIPAVDNEANPKARNKKAVKKVVYRPLSAVAVFPVIRHGQEKAFGDLPVIFSDEFSEKLAARIPDTKVMNPVYTVEEIKVRGLSSVYDKVMDYYIKAGKPEPKALQFLLNELSADGMAIQRVVFVEADVDLNQPARPAGAVERLKSWATDATPSTANYYVRSRVQVFNTEQADTPMVWSMRWYKALKAHNVMNVTPSVFQDSDSIHAFSGVSRRMSSEMLLNAPQEAYSKPETVIVHKGAVIGKILPQAEALPPMEVQAAPAERDLTAAEKSAIQKILKNTGSK